MPLQRPLVPFGLAVTVAILACGQEPAEPGGGGTAVVRPTIGYNADAQQIGNVSVDEVLVRVTRTDESTAFEGTFPFPADQNTLDIELSVPLRSNPENVFIDVTLLGQGNLLFSGGTSVDLVPGDQGESPNITLAYFGPGANIASLSLTPTDTAIFIGDSFTYDLTARDANQAAVALFYATWQLLSATGVSVNANGVVTGLAEGSALISARTPQPITSNFASVQVLPQPGTLALGGDNQTWYPGDTLPLNLVVHARKTDGSDLPNAPVVWTVTGGGGGFISGPGALTPTASTVTDGVGLSNVKAVLGPNPGANGFRATIGNRSVDYSADGGPGEHILFGGDTASGLGVRSVYLAVEGLFVFPVFVGAGNITPRWSPDRRRVVFFGAPPSGAFFIPPTLKVLDVPTGTGAVIVSDTPAFVPRWNRTGADLAFGCGTNDVCVIRGLAGQTVPLVAGVGDGGGKTFLSDAVDPVNGGTTAFAWDPTSGDSVVLARNVVLGNGVASYLAIVRSDAAGFRALSSLLADGQDPIAVQDLDWAPNGAFVVFSARTLAGATRLYRINRDGSGFAPLTTPPGTLRDIRPVISPNSQEIVFVRADIPNQVASADYFVVPATGGTPVQLSSEGVALAGPLDPGPSADWSPDGSELALVGIPGTGGYAIYRVPRTVTSANYLTVRLRTSRTEGLVTDFYPSWRP